MADLQAKISQARQAGYGDAEIASYLAQDADLGGKITQARDAGYSDKEVLAFLERPPEPKRKRNVYGEVAGAMANFNRGLGIGDEIAAAGNTAVGLLKGDIQPGGLLTGFRQNMADQRTLEDQYAADRPNTAGLLRGTGMAATAAVPAGGSVGLLAQSPRALNMARGATAAATQAAAYELADRGSLAERVGSASAAATNPATLALGAAAGALGPAARRAKAPTRAQTDAQVLADVGVSTTLPQRMGQGAKQIEDLLTRFPIIGQAVSGARGRQVEQLNRAVALKALRPVGVSLPKEVKPGFAMVEYVDDALGDVYDGAAKLVSTISPESKTAFADDLAVISERKADLPGNVANQFDSIVENRLARLARDDASGSLVKRIHSELGQLQSEAARKGESTLASMLGDTRRALMGVIERESPEAGELIRKADAGWGVYSIMNDAAASASNRGGVFLPGQLNTQVRAAGRSMGSNMTGKGKAPLQDMATAATRLIPDSFGNPGTANAALLSGGGVGAMTAPVETAIAAGALTAASTPYMLMGRKILTELPENASEAQLRSAADDLAELVKRDPAVRSLYEQITARLQRVAGVAGAAASGGWAPGGVESVEAGGKVYYPDGRVEDLRP